MCKQLCKDHGATVFLGSRNRERGEAAVKEVEEFAKGSKGKVELLILDVASDESVQAAAQELMQKGVVLTGLVNNAGTAAGFGHGSHVTNEDTMNVNLLGTKRCVDVFLDLLHPRGAKIVNVGSGSGPMYVEKQPIERQKKFCKELLVTDQIK